MITKVVCQCDAAFCTETLEVEVVRDEEIKIPLTRDNWTWNHHYMNPLLSKTFCPKHASYGTVKAKTYYKD